MEGTMATLNAQLRQGTGKGVARKLRSSGQIPAVSYGHGKEAQPLSINTHELELLLATINPENTIIDLKVEGSRSSQVLIREVQHHPSRPFIQHVDFFQVKAGEKLHVSVPVRLTGTPVGVREGGGVLQEVLHELSVECLPKDIPEVIDLDVDGLQVGDSIHVADVNLDRVTILNAGDLLICSVGLPTAGTLPEDAVGEDGVGGDVEPELVRDRESDAEDAETK
jgi:large subunit ribosomal protein L25